MADVTGRTLALLVTLQAGRAFSGDELASRLNVSPRTLRRDVDRLRGYGYPVETRPGPGGYYRLIAGRSMPPLVLDDDEAIATMLALATFGAVADTDGDSVHVAAARAYGKLDQFLPARLRPQLAAIRASLEAGQTSAPSITSRILADLATYTSRTEVVRFNYASTSGAISQRRCEPHRLVHLNLRWYLHAWDTGRGDWRTFRADRITDLRSTGARFQPRPLPQEGVVEHLRQGMGRRRQLVVLVVEAPAGRVADALRHQDADMEPLSAHRTRVRLRLDSWQWLVLNLAFLDADFTIDEPAELKVICHRFARRLGDA